MKMRSLKHAQQGMTLIEILIAMALGAFLLAGVIQIFLNSKQSYRMQENMSRMQENGRFAMEFISRDIRMADYWGCTDSTAGIENKIAAPPAASINGIAGLENDNGGNDGDANNDENANDIWDGTDGITLMGASSGSSVNLTVAAATLSDTDFTVAAGSQFVENDLALVSNCTSGDIFQITNDVAAGTTVSHVAGLGYGSSIATADDNIYGTDAKVYKLNIASYQIHSKTGIPSLVRSINGSNFEPLVEGIENMQITYGEDTDADGTPNYYVNASTAGLDMSKVVSIRISLLVSSKDDNLVPQPKVYIYNGASITPIDRRIRRVFSSTISVRNRLEFRK